MRKQFVQPALAVALATFGSFGSSCSAPPSSSSQDTVLEARRLASDLSIVFEEAADRVGPAVVPVFAESTNEIAAPFGTPQDPFNDFFGDEFFRRFFGQPPATGRPTPRTVKSMGSGVIVSEDGLILTNNHVVASAEKLTVVLEDGRRLEAKILGRDPPSDLAVIRIDAKGLQAANLGDSDELRVGQWVIAVGNPFQLLHTVTAGIISARGRSSIGLADYEDFIQTDASINPGNSGGALADLDGRVVGINTAISSPSGGSVGIGFAIPINMAKGIMTQLVDSGKVARGYLGLLPQDVTPELARALQLSEAHGSLVGDVTADSPAAKAGVKRGDVIVELDGQPVKDSVDLRSRVARAKPGAAVKLKVLRDGKAKELSVTLGSRPEEAGSSPVVREPSSTQAVQRLGLQVQALTPELARQLELGDASGALISQVAPGSAAESAGLQSGDLIIEVDRNGIDGPQGLEERLQRHSSGDSIALLVRRGSNTFYVALTIP